MILKRLLAVALAVGLVIGAVAIRRAFIDDGTADNGPAPEIVRLTCGSELEAVCEMLADGRGDIELTIEDPGLTTDRLATLDAGADPGFDAWLALGPWAGIVADNRQFGGTDGAVLEAETPTLGIARTALAVLVRGEDAAATCDPTPTWRCVGGLSTDIAKIGLPSPQRGDGLMILASAASSYFDGNQFDTIDLQDTEFQRWFTNLTQRSAGARPNRLIPLEIAITQPGTYNMVGALTEQINPKGRSGSAVTPYPDTVIAAPVQLATRTGLASETAIDLLDPDRIIESLEAHRYDPVSDGETAPPSELPTPGVLQSLRQMWTP